MPLSEATQLPNAVEGYLSASVDRDADAVAVIFTPDVRVADDGRTYDGHAAVMDWFTREASQFTCTTTYLGSEVTPEGHWRVANRLDGDFPGNTVTLNYIFRLADDGRIADLAIAPWPPNAQLVVALCETNAYRDMQPNIAESEKPMEFATIDREIFVEASPEIVFDVVSSPEHIKEWWNGAETDLSPTPGAVAEIAWDKNSPEPHIEALTVVDANPPHLFSFRWVYDGAAVATETNSLLVTFEMTPSGNGTTIRMTESGFREKGWDAAVLEAAYADHSNGWDVFVPSLGEYLARLVAAR